MLSLVRLYWVNWLLLLLSRGACWIYLHPIFVLALNILFFDKAGVIWFFDIFFFLRHYILGVVYNILSSLIIWAPIW